MWTSLAWSIPAVPFWWMAGTNNQDWNQQVRCCSSLCTSPKPRGKKQHLLMKRNDTNPGFVARQYAWILIRLFSLGFIARCETTWIILWYLDAKSWGQIILNAAGLQDLCKVGSGNNLGDLRCSGSYQIQIILHRRAPCAVSCIFFHELLKTKKVLSLSNMNKNGLSLLFTVISC